MSDSVAYCQSYPANFILKDKNQKIILNLVLHSSQSIWEDQKKWCRALVSSKGTQFYVGLDRKSKKFAWDSFVRIDPKLLKLV